MSNEVKLLRVNRLNLFELSELRTPVKTLRLILAQPHLNNTNKRFPEDSH